MLYTSRMMDVLVILGHVLLHALTASSATELADLSKAYELLPAALQQRWSRMASVNAYSGAVHPLVHRHPISGKKALQKGSRRGGKG